MLLSRFWYGLLAGCLAFGLLLLYLAQSIYNRAESRTLGERVNADRQAVSWLLRGDSRERSSLLLKFTLDENLISAVADSSAAAAGVPEKARARGREALAKIAGDLSNESANKPANELSREPFDAVFAIDQYGRVVAQQGFDAIENRAEFDLGGYSVVADALRGFVRDDTLLLKQLYRVVARPVLHTAGAEPVGAVLAATLIDARFAQRLADQAQTAVTFYHGGKRRETGAPPGFSKGLFDQIDGELPLLQSDEDYAKAGVSKVRWPNKSFGVMFSKLPGEAWQLGAGFAVGRDVRPIATFWGFWTLKDEKDKGAVGIPVIVGLFVISLGVGLLFSFLEHDSPIRAFAREAARLARGEISEFQPSKFRGGFRKIASDINDGLSTAGGNLGRPADLHEVLGGIPSKPQMSAFTFPEQSPAEPAARVKPPPPEPPPRPRRPAPVKPEPMDEALSETPLRLPALGSPGLGPANRSRADDPAMVTRLGVGVGVDPAQEPEQEWQQVFKDFVRTKEQCGEKTNGLSYDRFRLTLQKNQAAILRTHEANRVRFSVYVKDGKAALKASPIKD